MLQSSYSIGEFTDTLRLLRQAQDDQEITADELVERENSVRFQFDILWSFLNDFSERYPENRLTGKSSGSIFQLNEKFLAENEPLMAKSYSLTEQDINNLILGADQLADGVLELGRGYFFTTVTQTDVVEQQVDQLFNYIQLFIAFLLLTGGLGTCLLYTSDAADE